MVEDLMQTVSVVAGLVALAILLSPSVAAVTTKVTPPEGPTPYNSPTTLEVIVETTCQEILNDNPTDSAMQLDLIAGSSVGFLEAMGSKIDWTRSKCNLSNPPNFPASTTGTVTITPKNIAPALENADITLEVANKEGTASFPVKVAHYATFSASTDRPVVKAGLAENQPFNITLEIATNAVSTLTFNVTQATTHGTVRGLEDLLVEPNIAQYIEHHAGFFVWTDGGPKAGEPLSLKVPLTYASSATVWPAENLTLELRMFPNKDPSLTSEPVSLSWSFEPTVTEQPKGESPAPNVLLILLLLATAVVLRRKAA
jgi:hypothetical protein